MRQSPASILCLSLNFVAIALLVYMLLVQLPDTGEQESGQPGKWGVGALLMFAESALLYYLTEHHKMVRIVWFLSAACFLGLIAYHQFAMT